MLKVHECFYQQDVLCALPPAGVTIKKHWEKEEAGQAMVNM